MQKRLCTHIFKSKLKLANIQTVIINMIKVIDSFNKKKLLHGLGLLSLEVTKISKNCVLQNEGHQLLTLPKNTKASDVKTAANVSNTHGSQCNKIFLPQNTEDATSLMRLLLNICKKSGKAAYLRQYWIQRDPLELMEDLPREKKLNLFASAGGKGSLHLVPQLVTEEWHNSD